jgi:uncharacterized protein YjbI with pentapeptide repeats
VLLLLLLLLLRLQLPDISTMLMMRLTPLPIRMPRVQMQQCRHIKSTDIFTPSPESSPAIFSGASFMGCDLEGVVFDGRVDLAACNFSGTAQNPSDSIIISHRTLFSVLTQAARC